MAHTSRISIIVGTRPNLIKISPLVTILSRNKQCCIQFINTGQHYDYEMDALFIEELNLPDPTYLKCPQRDPAKRLGSMITSIADQTQLFKPNIIIVIGDTNSTLAGALTAKKCGVPLGHIEAGLRIHTKETTEEVNRRIIDHISTLLFAPTPNAVSNLHAENISSGKIKLVGDLTVDALNHHQALAQSSKILDKTGITKGKFFLATIHRQENTSSPQRLESLLHPLNNLAKIHPVIFPLHPSTRNQLKCLDTPKSSFDKISFIDPVGYLDFIKLLSTTGCVLTDSGGIQKEAFILKVPCVTLRQSTEWPETLTENANVIADNDPQLIVREALKRATPQFHQQITLLGNPFGDGQASNKIINHITEYLNEL